MARIENDEEEYRKDTVFNVMPRPDRLWQPEESRRNDSYGKRDNGNSGKKDNEERG